MTDRAGDKYIATRALDWLNDIWGRFFDWLLDEERGYKRFNMVVAFIMGAIVIRVEPRAFHYAAEAVGLLIFLLFVICCLFPFALLIEWAFRKVSNCQSWTATRPQAGSKPIPHFDRSPSSRSPLTRSVAKKRRRERLAAMTMCRSLLARANCWRKFANTCNSG